MSQGGVADFVTEDSETISVTVNDLKGQLFFSKSLGKHKKYLIDYLLKEDSERKSRSINQTIRIDLRGNYTFAIRNNSNYTVNVFGFVNY